MARPNKLSGAHPGRPSREALFERLEAQVAELRREMGGLPLPARAAEIWHEIWVHEAHHSTAIEGNTLVLSQVEELLDRGRAVGNKELREYMEVRGYAAAADWVYRHGVDPDDWSGKRLLTITDLRHLHRLALDLVWEVDPHPQANEDERPGSFR